MNPHLSINVDTDIGLIETRYKGTVGLEEAIGILAAIKEHPAYQPYYNRLYNLIDSEVIWSIQDIDKIQELINKAHAQKQQVIYLGFACNDKLSYETLKLFKSRTAANLGRVQEVFDNYQEAFNWISQFNGKHNLTSY